MSLEFMIAFGGPLILGVIGSVVMARMRTSRASEPRSSDSMGELDAALATAQAAARRAEIEIARVRARLAS